MRDFRAMNKYRGDVAARYDEKRAEKDATRRDQAIVENYLSKIAPGSPVLDIPAGTGRFIQFCLGRGLRYTGVDISADMLEVARTKVRAGANVELTVADARALPFEDDAFDYAIIIKFIKWLPTVETLTEVLREIKRVTRKEAFVQIKVTRELPLKSRAASLLRQLPIARHVLGAVSDKNGSSGAGKTPTRPFRSFSQQELDQAFSAAGLHVRAIVPDGDLRRGRNFYILSKQVD